MGSSELFLRSDLKQLLERMTQAKLILDSSKGDALALLALNECAGRLAFAEIDFTWRQDKFVITDPDIGKKTISEESEQTILEYENMVRESKNRQLSSDELRKMRMLVAWIEDDGYKVR